jgi:prolipoprotein diacylglyceryl transferase
MLDYIVWNVKPEIFSIGSFSLRWYGVLFASAFFFGYLIMNRIFKKEQIPGSVLDKLTIYMAIGTILGARLGHCFFYEPEYFLKHPVEILTVWHGGLASHGATIGILIALWLFSRNIKKNVWWIFDRVTIVVALGGFFIRLGNLMNSEIYGKPADVPWAFQFVSADTIPRHPTQIYEALFCIVIFITLLIMYERKAGNIPALLSSVFFILLWVFRFFIEFLKEPQVAKEASMLLNIGQLLSIPFALLGVAFLFWSLHRYKRKQTASQQSCGHGE